MNSIQSKLNDANEELDKIKNEYQLVNINTITNE
jgi:hypothetical protein